MAREESIKYNEPGVYVHPGIPGRELNAKTVPKADAYVRMGFVLKTDEVAPATIPEVAPKVEKAPEATKEVKKEKENK